MKTMVSETLKEQNKNLKEAFTTENTEHTEDDIRHEKNEKYEEDFNTELLGVTHADLPLTYKEIGIVLKHSPHSAFGTGLKPQSTIRHEKSFTPSAFGAAKSAKNTVNVKRFKIVAKASPLRPETGRHGAGHKLRENCLFPGHCWPHHEPRSKI
jgi:hypothetical protein